MLRVVLYLGMAAGVSAAYGAGPFGPLGRMLPPALFVATIEWVFFGSLLLAGVYAYFWVFERRIHRLASRVRSANSDLPPG